MPAPTGWPGPPERWSTRWTSHRSSNSRPAPWPSSAPPPPQGGGLGPSIRRDDWPTALRIAGFDYKQPTAWSAEGLLGYLPPEAQDRLLDTITALSAPGSRIATESGPTREPGHEERIKERMRKVSERWRKHGLDLDMTELVYFGDRNEAAAYLSDPGWQMGGSTIREMFAANGLPPIEEDDLPVADRLYVSGTLTDKK